jgi:hypothetical protein
MARPARVPACLTAERPITRIWLPLTKARGTLPSHQLAAGVRGQDGEIGVQNPHPA